MKLSEIVDGFVYLCLTYPTKPIESIYHTYMEFLEKKGIDPRYQYFYLLIQVGENARESSDICKKQILKNITYIPKI